MKSVNLDLVKKEMKAEPKYEEVMGVLANRDRARAGTTFSRIKRMLDESDLKGWTKEELGNFFLMLEKAGAGYIVKGKNDTKFIWNFDLKSVARSALGMEEVSGELKKPPVPRRKFPKLNDQTPPTSFKASQGRLNAVSLSVKGVPATLTGNTLIFNRGGSEFEINLSDVPQSAIKFVRFSE